MELKLGLHVAPKGVHDLSLRFIKDLLPPAIVCHDLSTTLDIYSYCQTESPKTFVIYQPDDIHPYPDPTGFDPLKAANYYLKLMRPAFEQLKQDIPVVLHHYKPVTSLMAEYDERLINALAAIGRPVHLGWFRELSAINRPDWSVYRRAIEAAVYHSSIIGFGESYSVFPFMEYPGGLNVPGKKGKLLELVPFPRQKAVGNYVGHYRNFIAEMKYRVHRQFPRIMIEFKVANTTDWCYDAPLSVPDDLGWQAHGEQWKYLRPGGGRIARLYFEDIVWANEVVYQDTEVISFNHWLSTDQRSSHALTTELLDHLHQYKQRLDLSRPPVDIPIENWLERATKRLGKSAYRAALTSSTIVENIRKKQ